MNGKIDIDSKRVTKMSEIDAHDVVDSGGIAFRTKIVTTCVAIEFVAISAAFVGVTPNVFWVAIGASTMSAIFAFVLAWRVFHPLAGTALAVVNALTCYRLWSVPFLISAGGLNKYLLIVVLLVRVIGWIALLIINRRARSVLEIREARIES